MRLLVVDFDYFFPVPQDQKDPLASLYAWAHFETPYYQGEVWEERALVFLLRGLSLPQAQGWEGFWERFSFAQGTQRSCQELCVRVCVRGAYRS